MFFWFLIIRLFTVLGLVTYLDDNQVIQVGSEQVIKLLNFITNELGY
jgi:uncharacterized protein (DUF2164 family)